VLAHLIHGDVAGGEPVDDREHVVAVEAKRKLPCSRQIRFSQNLDALYESVT
jgi:hypothetical protein